MPSPVGHALVGMAAGWMVTRPKPRAHGLGTQATILAAIGAAPDLDLVVRHHREITHTLGAAVVIAVVAAWARWPIADTRARIALAAFVAWFSHPVLDALAVDSWPPYGVMLFWPLSTKYFLSPWPIFAAIERRWHEPTFVVHNVEAILREIVILVPVTLVVWWLRRPHDAPST